MSVSCEISHTFLLCRHHFLQCGGGKTPAASDGYSGFKPSQFISFGKIDDAYDKLYAENEELTRDLEFAYKRANLAVRITTKRTSAKRSDAANS